MASMALCSPTFMMMDLGDGGGGLRRWFEGET